MKDQNLHAVVAQSRFGMKHVQNTSTHTMFGAVLEVEMSKKCTPLQREAHLEVNLLKALGFGPLFDDSIAI